MTRSKASTFAPKNAKRTLQQQASAAGYTQRLARHFANTSIAVVAKQAEPIVARRNPGRMDGVSWNGRSFVCPRQVDDQVDSDVDDEWDNEFQVDPTTGRHNITTTISLLDIAKPAKLKGIAKKFDVIDTLPKVIVLENDDEMYSEVDDDDWEEIYAETQEPVKGHTKTRKAYSAVLRGNDG